jgi:glutathione S-transferase
MIYRYTQLIPERPATPHLDRWYGEISQRAAFRAHVSAIKLV